MKKDLKTVQIMDYQHYVGWVCTKCGFRGYKNENKPCPVCGHKNGR